jgi:metallo-beta-lactamase class B
MYRRALLLALLAVSLSAATDPDWSKPFQPFRIVGNIYWVGTWDLSSYLIVTPQGDILINTGLADSAPQILGNVQALGFKVSDIKIITATHAHYDHVAGIAEIKRLTGAKLVMEEEDVPVMESGGKKDFRFGKDPSMRFTPVHVDEALKDGSKITLGGTEITLHHHPGHTKGASSFTLTVRDTGHDLRVGIINLGSINPGVKVSGMPTYPNIAQDYARTFHDQKEIQIDVFLASHASQFGLHEKYKPGDWYQPARFVDPQGFHDAVEKLEKVYTDQLARERAGQSK